MDLILVLLIILVIGIPRLSKVSDSDSAMVMNNDGTITQTCDSSDLPIGNNLMLKHEPDAFTMIIRELGLRK